MTLTDLRYLVALAHERHFGRAAEKCHVSQPTLSVAVKKVEEELGIQLFERSASEVKITETGRRIVAQAERVLMEASQIQEIAAAGKDPLAGPLRVGVIYTIGPYLLPRLIPRVHQLAPRMPLIIQENFTARLAEALKRGELDVIIISLPFDEAGVVAQPVYDEPFRVLIPADHPWNAESEIDPQHLADDQLLLLGAGNCFRDQVLEVCPSCRNIGGLQRTLEGSSLETIRHMVATGLGVTVLPSSAADEMATQNPLVAVRPFTMPEPSRRVALAWRVTYPRNGAIDVLRAAILDSALPGVRPVGRAVPPGQVPWVDSR
ncbi:hydrogen peroxide-inducible genes activator [Thauera aminoaromatica]|jgi:LysR family hydrogen peroxide-inducible transcriptional activator|uniref:LysR family transcriptional regulator n=2 Tax=Thauera aminoaromatica TaxID=164330 RepID=N6Y5Z3_THASP|nr:hydrogen peroxide-inducible genes activator [Thauera aminoaromatica]ACK52903.1 transcriptional regulator, LysR family [Thauera aminoaromatica]ENO87015.1 LysR family transcriptional regulator [Thauera aminoaromatica S2]